jgi:putative membrane protein
VNRVSKPRKRSFAKGAVAGLIGGIVAIVAKNAAEKIYPPRTSRKLEPPILAARKSSGKALTVKERSVAQQTLHVGLGAAAGAAYGAVAEVYPAATSKQGASFGMALIALNQDRALPMLGRFIKAEPQTKREHTSELVSFVVFGVVTETVRRVVRRLIE